MSTTHSTKSDSSNTFASEEKSNSNNNNNNNSDNVEREEQFDQSQREDAALEHELGNEDELIREESESQLSEEVVSFGGDGIDNNNNVDLEQQREEEEYGELVDEEKIDTGSLTRSESNILINRKLSKILTGVDDNEHRDVSYEGCPPMGGDRPYPPSLPDRGPWEVAYDGPNDPLHPFNWPMRKRVFLVMILAMDCMAVTMGSSAFASAVPQVCEEYGVIEVVAILGVTLYVLGFAISPVVYAPLSELYGRQYILIISSFGFALFQFAVASAENLQTIMLCRFFGGAIGAAPLAVIPAAMSDMFNNRQRGTVISLFSLTVFLGPILTPVFTSYIVEYTSWRWIEYTIGIYASLCFIVVTYFYEETHHPIILCRKAAMLRKKSGNWGIYAAHENNTLSISEIVTKTISRPLKMLATEPILFLLTIYNSFVYGILYLMLEAYPIVFEKGYGFTKNGELPYIALIIGMGIFSMVMVFYFEPRYVKSVDANNGKPCPEERLKPMMISGFIFPIGILWFCWTGNYHNSVNWIVPTIGGSFIGFGLIGIFLTSFNYIIDSYLFLAASAIAGNTFLRSGFGAAFPLFAGYMFDDMGTNWAGLLLGLFAIVLIPVPFLFYKYGVKLRTKSKYAYVL